MQICWVLCEVSWEVARNWSLSLFTARSRPIFRTRSGAAIKHLWQRPGVRWRVVLLSLLIPLLCANAVFIWQDYHWRRQAIVAEHYRQSVQISDEVEDFLQALEGVTQDFAARWVKRYPSTSTDPESLAAQESHLMEFVEYRSEFSNGYITDSAGLIRISSGPALIGERLGPVNLYQQAYSSQTPGTSDVMVPYGGQDPFILFVRPLRWNADHPEGFLVLQTRLVTIIEVLNLSTDLSPGAKVTILDSQGRVLARYEHQTSQPEIALGADVSDSDFWKNALGRPAKEQYGRGLAGSNRVIFLSYPESTPWIAAVSYDEAEVFQPLWHRLWALMGAGILSVVAALWVGEVWVRREQRMVTALEERVEERTAELSESNLALRREIAERARIAEALRSSEEQQRALVTAIPDLILQIGEDGTIRSAKPGNALLEHWALDVCQGKRIGQLLPPDIGQSYLDYVHRALQTGEVQVFDHELDIGGEVLSCEARLVVSGQDQVVAIIRDITRERRLEKQFLLSQKMESAGRLAGGIAHEFNNLLAAIIGFSSLALESSDPNGKARSYLQQSLKASERGADLVQRFLTFARSKGSKLSIFDLNELIIETDKLLRHLIGEDIELVIVPSLNPEPVEADRNQIQQVIVNLATNARDAMPEGGKLIIGTASVNLSQPQGVGQLEPAPGKFAVLTVTDTGTGMDDEVKAHLFEPFFTTKEVGKGTGLGLSICYGLVSQNSGYIEVESSPDQGTTFKIYLPKAEARLEVIASENGLESGSPLQGTETVLLAEDEPLVRSLVSDLLRDQGYIVLEATNGLEALSMAQEYAGGQIDLLLSDVVMPLMGGRELAERLLMIFPGIKVLFMSGYTQGSTFYIDALGPQVELIQKPFPPNVLLLKVSEVMNEVKYPNAEPVNQTR